jgi:hypothetical protein
VSDECTCGRPRATDADLARWVDVAGDRPIEAHPAPLPASELWANALCWTMPGQRRCAMRRRWASDTHIGVARSVFALYQLGVVVR